MNIDNCNLCGLCKRRCPVYQEIQKEQDSPRTKALFLKLNKPNKIFYNCTECKFCNVDCPNDVRLDFIKARAAFVDLGFETKNNKKMVDNMRKYGNPFGDKKKIKDSKNLFDFL